MSEDATDVIEWTHVVIPQDVATQSVPLPPILHGRPLQGWHALMQILDPTAMRFEDDEVATGQRHVSGLSFRPQHERLILFCQADLAEGVLTISYQRLDQPIFWQADTDHQVHGHSVLDLHVMAPQAYFRRVSRHKPVGDLKTFNTRHLRLWFDSHIPQRRSVTCDLRDALAATLCVDDDELESVRRQLFTPRRQGRACVWTLKPDHAEQLLTFLNFSLGDPSVYSALHSAARDMNAGLEEELAFYVPNDIEGARTHWMNMWSRHGHSRDIWPCLAVPNSESPEGIVEQHMRQRDGTERIQWLNKRSQAESRMIPLPQSYALSL